MKRKNKIKNTNKKLVVHSKKTGENIISVAVQWEERQDLDKQKWKIQEFQNGIVLRFQLKQQQTMSEKQTSKSNT